MLLIIETLLLILAALRLDHRTAADGFQLDMAEKSVDDQYKGCTDNMTHLVKTKYLKKEMSNSKFARVWKDAEKNLKTQGDNLSKNHTVAIYAYTNNDTSLSLYKVFNDAVRDGNQYYKNGKYEWYSLHFWLTEAIQILKKTQTQCYNTYRGIDKEFDKTVKDKEVRFGQFASSSFDRQVAKRYGNKSCFEIKTCEGAYLSKYSKFPDQEEVLIPPYEKFKVTDVQTRAVKKDLWCETVFILKSSGTRSDLNCASSGNQVAFFNIVFILMAFCHVVTN